MSMSRQTPSCSMAEANNNDASNFECNICLDLADDPIITLCGHLYCWPCLYKWLYTYNSKTHDCPVCKAPVNEQNLIPLYGHGKKNSDNGTSESNIPCRPAGQRPDTVPRIDRNYFEPLDGYGFRPGLESRSWVSTRYGSYTFAAAFGGVVPWLRWDYSED